MKKEKKYYLFEMKGTMLSIISLVILLIMIAITYLIDKNLLLNLQGFYLAFIFMYPYLFLHEIFHSLSYVIHGAKFKNITYGIHLDKGVLCCLCKQNITKTNILISLLYPFIFIGIITYVIGIIINNSTLVILSILNISGCAGDIMMFIGLSKLKNFEFSEYDNPIAFGLYSSEDLSKVNLTGLEYIDKVDELEKKDFKKLSISKSSIGIIIVYIVLIILLLILDVGNIKDIDKSNTEEYQIYYEDDVTIYTYGMDSVKIGDIELKDYIAPLTTHTSTAINELLENNENFEVVRYRDGGTTRYYNDELQILICNKLESHKNIYISNQEINYTMCE